MAPNSSVGTLSAVRLRATLAAPPGMKLSFWNSTTGTGASGEMRETLPQMNSSSMTSPMTRTRWLAKRAMMASALRSADIAGGFRMEVGRAAVRGRGFVRDGHEGEAGPRDDGVQT